MNTLSNIPKIVSIEFQKARHKHFPLLFLAALLLDCAYLFYGTKAHSETWLNIFYALPIINTPVKPKNFPPRRTIPIWKLQNRTRAIKPKKSFPR